MTFIQSEIGWLRSMTEEEWERRQAQLVLYEEWKRLHTLFTRLCGEQVTRIFFGLDRWLDNEGQPHPFIHTITVYDDKGEVLPFQIQEDVWNELCFSENGHANLREEIKARLQETGAASSTEVQSVVQESFAFWWSEEGQLPSVLENGYYDLSKTPAIDYPLVYIPV